MSNFINHIDKEWSKLREFNIFVACSGGVDSTVLAIVLKRLGFKITVLHMNYQLRGEDSELDADFIKSFCRNERITCLQKNINLNAQLSKGGNLQELARNARYDWFQHVIKQNEKNFIALGHHQDDQVETFFLNLARKSGIMGLACMLPEHNRIIRPLLDFSRDEIERFAKEEEIQWREDISNSSNKYNRNKLRNVILPELREELPKLNNSVSTLIHAFQQEQKRIETEVTPISESLLSDGEISIDKLNNLNDHQLIELLRQTNQPSSLLLDFKNLLRTERGKKIAWGKTWLTNEGNSLQIQNTEKIHIPKLILEPIKELPDTFTKESIYLDKAMLSGDLKARIWQTGDRINPIGMKGSKLISDIIKDAKLDSSKKRNVIVIHDDKCIHWCYQLTVGRNAIASEKSNEIIKLTIS